MSRGAASYLTTRSPAEAWRTVKRLLQETDHVQRQAAARLGVHYRTLHQWLRRHGYAEEVKKMRAEWLAKQVEE